MNNTDPHKELQNVVRETGASLYLCIHNDNNTKGSFGMNYTVEIDVPLNQFTSNGNFGEKYFNYQQFSDALSKAVLKESNKI